ncbi:40S ribosomal protein S8 [Atta colombica]|uniref:40S ribosomal protein S8 n=1 Tax=Atta colombica TaxID=520822 RepID=A0A195BC06_9HYME|nr:40S ribosomal protein S8 [Atta colombica]
MYLALWKRSVSLSVLDEIPLLMFPESSTIKSCFNRSTTEETSIQINYGLNSTFYSLEFNKNSYCFLWQSFNHFMNNNTCNITIFSVTFVFHFRFKIVINLSRTNHVAQENNLQNDRCNLDLDYKYILNYVRTRGGNKKYRALRLDAGNFSWGSECSTRKTRIIDVVYNASNNELVRTKTLVKNAIVTIDATPFRQWYEGHYVLPLGRKRGAKLTEAEEEVLNKKRSKKAESKYKARQRFAKVEPALEEQFATGRVLACIASRPGQCGRADGYILEGKELEFYMRKIKSKKAK